VTGSDRNTRHVERQQRFYDTRVHDHLQAKAADYYASKLAHRLADSLGIGPGDRVLEVGAGFGRFTFPLLERCGQVVALDLSAVALEKLEAERAARGIEASRIEAHCGDLDAFSADASGERFDFIVGFFLLHHLPRVEHSVAGLARRLAPAGRIGFLEPNRRNPLFLAQVAACADMTWAEERGMFALSRRGIEAAYRAAGLEVMAAGNFGFFPPQVLNAWPLSRRLESWLEARRALHGVLPFLVLAANAPVSRPEPAT